MTHAEKVKKIVRILKKNFDNLDTGKAVHVGYQIVEALEEPASRIEINQDQK